MDHFVVVGGGQAGASLVAKLRTSGFEGRITLICGEDVPPYQRPPLSKGYLLGEMELERLFLRSPEFYPEHNIDLRLSTHVSAIDPVAKTVTTSTGEVIAYDKLALTTGSTPRRLPAAVGGDLGGVFTMRDLKDADRLAPEMRPGRHMLVIGGGYIGLEAAAVAAKSGLKVTLIEMADRILQRVAAPITSDFFRDLHQSHGVDIREGIGLKSLTGEGHVSGADLSDSSHLDVDLVIVGIGITPNTQLAETAGLTVENGIWTDSHGRTSDSSIWAAGDCASLVYHGQRIRLESVGNAIDQAEVVAQNMMGGDVAYQPRPWFWSDQYDCKLQIGGLNMGYDAVHLRKAAGESQSHWYYKGDELIAVDAMNDPRDYMVGKRLIEAGKSPSPEVIRDPATDMKALLRS
jgi:3-phenylpropionate/trans-cinnamate dioxygenase ferredoxin reductase subunit